MRIINACDIKDKSKQERMKWFKVIVLNRQKFPLTLLSEDFSEKNVVRGFL